MLCLDIKKGVAAPRTLQLRTEIDDVGKEEEPVYYTARHLLQALKSLDERLLDLPLVLVHGKELTKPNLVSGIIPSPIPVERVIVQ